MENKKTLNGNNAKIELTKHVEGLNSTNAVTQTGKQKNKFELNEMLAEDARRFEEENKQ